jgi:hypothetical protein
MPATLRADDPLAIAAADVIRSGKLTELKRLLAEHPSLATARVVDGASCAGQRTLLHLATDWPGHFPNVAATVAALVDAGADVNARFIGTHSETPLHWAASSNDVNAIDALLDAGADIEAAGAIIGGGSPLADARGFGQWKAAHRLLERGATPGINDAATLGLIDLLRSSLDSGRLSDPDHITRAFWAACHGGQLHAAELLLEKGADINWIGQGEMTPLDVAMRPDAARLVGDDAARALIVWLRACGATGRQDRNG